MWENFFFLNFKNSSAQYCSILFRYLAITFFHIDDICWLCKRTKIERNLPIFELIRSCIYIYILFVKEIYPFLHFSRIKFIYIVLKNACINIFRAKKYCSYLFCVFVNYFPHYMWMNVMAFVFCLWRFHRLDILLLTMNRFYRRQQRRVYRSKLISNHRR